MTHTALWLTCERAQAAGDDVDAGVSAVPPAVPPASGYNKRMARFFNTAGPCFPGAHDLLLPEERLPKLRRLP